MHLTRSNIQEAFHEAHQATLSKILSEFRLFLNNFNNLKFQSEEIYVLNFK